MASIILDVVLNEKGLIKATKQLENQLKAVVNTSGNGDSIGKATQRLDTLRKSVANLINTIGNTKNKYPEGTFSSIEGSARKLSVSLKDLDAKYKSGAISQEAYTESVVKLGKQTNNLQVDFAELRAETERNTSAVIQNGDSIGKLAGKFFQWQIAATLVMQTINLFRNAFESVNETLVETEKRVIAISRVLDENINKQRIANGLYDIAEEYGQTFENVADIATRFAQAGLSWNETLEATRVAVLALNVAELDAEQSSQGLIAVMKQFGYEATDLEMIIDKLNITADKNAVTTDALLAALQRTGSSAKNANLTLEETVSIVTALSEATGRSGENLGTAVNSLIQFSAKSKSLETFAKLGGSVAKAVEDYRMGAGTILDIWKQLSLVIKGNNAETESILAGLFGDEDWRNLNEQLQEELGENFAQITEIYGTASTFRKNYFIALLNNMEQVQEVQDEMANSQGYSQKENEKYLDTYEAKVTALQAKWQQLANDEQGFLKFKKDLVDIASVLLDIVDAVGGLETLFSLFTNGLVGTFVTGIENKILSNRETAKEKADELIEIWKAHKKQADALHTLYERYKQLDQADKDYLQIEKELVSYLSEDKQQVLSDLVAGTDEYRTAVEKLTEAQLEQYKAELNIAKNTASAELSKSKIWAQGSEMKMGWNLTGIFSKLGVKYAPSEHWWYGSYFDGLSLDKTAEAQLANYKFFENLLPQIATALNNAVLEGDTKKVEQYTEAYNYIKEIVEKYGDIVTNYESAVNGLWEIENLGNKNDDGGGGEPPLKEAISDLSQINDKYEEILTKLREMRDIEREENELLKAKQALLDAQNERNVRVFNATTGQWEWQANQKSIEQARENLENAAWDKIESALEAGNITNEKIREIVDTIGKEVPSFAEDVREFFKRFAEIDIGETDDDTVEPTPSLKEPDHEPFVPPTLSVEPSPEPVTPTPSLKEPIVDIIPIEKDTSQNLSEIYDNYTGLAGNTMAGKLLFGSENRPAPFGGILANNFTGGNTDNSRSYVVNGVPISTQDAEKHTIVEIFSMMPLIHD